MIHKIIYINSFMNLFNDHLNLSNNIYDNAKILKSVELNKQQELVNRNPTTKYYQTLVLNLQEQVQYLTKRLNETAPPTVFHGAPESEFGSPPQSTLWNTTVPYGTNNPTGNGSFPEWNIIDTILTGDKNISQRLIKFARNNPRLFTAEVLGLLSFGKVARAADRVSILLTSPELAQLAEHLFNLTPQALSELLQAIKNGTASQSDLAAFNAFWNLANSILTGWIPSANDFNLNAGAGPDRPGDPVYNSGDGSYRGTRDGIFYQPPLPIKRRSR